MCARTETDAHTRATGSSSPHSIFFPSLLPLAERDRLDSKDFYCNFCYVRRSRVLYDVAALAPSIFYEVSRT